MKLVTIQASAIKATFEVLKDILNDVNVYFRKDGVSIVTLDTARTSLVDMHLSADNFEKYTCDTDIDAGINVTNMFKLLKVITNNDVLMLKVDCKEFMKIEIHNEQKKTSTNFALKLLDINENQIEVPDMTMTTTTPMSSVDFQRICRDMSNIGTEIKIERYENKLKLSCDGDFANQETQIECPENSPSMTGVYSLRYVNIFTKATSMCSTVQVMQEDQNRFLILKYNVANLGDLKFYLATKVAEDH